MKYSIFWLRMAEEQVWNLTLEGDIAASTACSQTRTPSFNLWCCKNYKPLTLNNGPRGGDEISGSIIFIQQYPYFHSVRGFKDSVNKHVLLQLVSVWFHFELNIYFTRTPAVLGFGHSYKTTSCDSEYSASIFLVSTVSSALRGSKWCIKASLFPVFPPPVRQLLTWFVHKWNCFQKWFQWLMLPVS